MPKPAFSVRRRDNGFAVSIDTGQPRVRTYQVADVNGVAKALEHYYVFGDWKRAHINGHMPGCPLCHQLKQSRSGQKEKRNEV